VFGGEKGEKGLVTKRREMDSDPLMKRRRKTVWAPRRLKDLGRGLEKRQRFALGRAPGKTKRGRKWAAKKEKTKAGASNLRKRRQR